MTEAPNEESDWFPPHVKVAANTIGYAAELQGFDLDRQQVLTVAVYLDHHGLLARLPHMSTEPLVGQTDQSEPAPETYVGKQVLYTLGTGDIAEINRVFPMLLNHRQVRNNVMEGDVFPGLVVRVFDSSASTSNLQVFLDGIGVYWATSRTKGEGESHWQDMPYC